MEPVEEKKSEPAQNTSGFDMAAILARRQAIRGDDSDSDASGDDWK